MMRVLIFTSVEHAFYSSVIEYQLLEPFVELAKKPNNREVKFVYIGFVPITFWVSKRSPISSFRVYRTNRKKINRWLIENKIPCRFVAIPFPLRHKDLFLRIGWLGLYVISTLPLFIYFLLRYKINLVHARNYPACLLALLGKGVLGIKYNFDMRDLYPEKAIEAGIFSPNSWSYKLWKFIEYKLVREAKYVITTSEPFKEYVMEKLKVKSEKLKVLPNCVNTRRFKPDEKNRAKIRAKYGLVDKFVLLHSGAFGTAPDLPLILKFFLRCKEIKLNAHLVILCPIKERLPQILRLSKELGISSQDLTLLSAKPEEVPKLILLGDVGLHLESMAIATPYCIAVKDGEYLSSGLPIICTPWLRGIAPLIEKYKAGIVIDTTQRDKETLLLHLLIDRYKELRDNGFKLVEEVLSLDHCVRKLAQIYR